MTAFPQLGHGFNSNVVTAPENPASEEAKFWWRHLSDDKKVELIIKEHPDSVNQSPMMRMALWIFFNKNPQKLFDKAIEENL